MKNSIKIILLISVSLLLLIGCSSKKQEKVIDNVINNLLSVKTYEGFTFWGNESEDVDIEEEQKNWDKYEEDLKASFGEYFTEDGLDTLMSNLGFYSIVIKENNVKDITDIKIVKTKESENNTYENYEFIYYEYEVSYKLKLDDKSIDMTDYMSFRVMKNNSSLIDEVNIDREKSSIFSEYENVNK